MLFRYLRALVPALVLVLPACADTDWWPLPGTPGPATPESGAPTAPPPKPAGAARAKTTDTARADPARDPRRGEPERYDPHRLIGLNRDQVKQLLGLPDHARDEASGLVWSFRRRDCSLDIVFYSSVDGTDLRVFQYNIGSDASERDRSGELCVGSMVTSARDKQR
jgi:hypothetical protein